MDILELTEKAVEVANQDEGLKEKIKDTVVTITMLLKNDVIEVMSSSRRAYRPALGINKALKEISKNKGILYDSEVADTCLKLFTKKGFTFG